MCNLFIVLYIQRSNVVVFWCSYNKLLPLYLDIIVHFSQTYKYSYVLNKADAYIPHLAVNYLDSTRHTKLLLGLLQNLV